MAETSAGRPIDWHRYLAVVMDYLLVALMLVCFTIAFVQLIEHLVAGWDGTYLVLVSFIVAAETLTSNRLQQYTTPYTRDWLLWHITEWVTILLSIKLLLYAFHGFGQLGVELSHWRTDFAGTFFNPEYVAASLYAIFVWFLSTYFAGHLNQLEEDPETLSLEKQGVVRTDMSRTLAELRNTIFGLGAAMLVLVALTRLDFEALQLRQAVGQAWNLILYFVLGLVLLAHTRYISLRTTWYLEDIPVGKSIAIRWAAYSLIMLAIVSVISLLLPTGYSIGFLSLIGSIVGTISQAIWMVLSLLFYPFFLLLNLFSHLFGRNPQDITPLPPPGLPAINTGNPASIPWLEWVRSFLFWGLFFGIIGYSLYYYITQRTQLATALRQARLLRWLADLLASIRSLFRKTAVQAVLIFNQNLDRVRDRVVRRSRKAVASRPPGTELSPREQVREIYLDLIGRAGESGLGRRAEQTPIEFAGALEKALPETTGEIEALTSEFVEARYTQHPMTGEHTSLARHAFIRISALLLKKDETKEEP